jgi:uncharacterized membrane protein
MADEYWMIGGDEKEYGPVSLATLVQWIQEHRVIETTRVRKADGRHLEARRHPELMGYFSSQDPVVAAAAAGGSGTLVLPREFRVWEFVGLAWNAVRNHWLVLAAMFFIQTAIGCVPKIGPIVHFVIGGAISVGIWRAVLGTLDGRRPEVGMMFEGFDRFLDGFLACLVIGILVALGFVCLIVPGIILLLMWSFTFPILAETKLGFWEAMGASAALTKGYRWDLFLLALASVLILLLGLIVFCVGVFVSLAVVAAAWAIAFRFLQRQNRPAAQPA